MRRGEKERTRREVVMSIDVLWRKESRGTRCKRNGRCKNQGELKMNCLIYNVLDIDPKSCHASWLWGEGSQ